MSTMTFTVSDLMELLSQKAGLPRAAHTADPQSTLDDIGLDSLAFLALQTELADRYGFELPEDRPQHDYTVGAMAADIDAQLAATPSREATG